MRETLDFPILNGQRLLSIPWEMIEKHEPQALRNHKQSLETLARRGGLSACEVVAVIEGRRWERMDDAEAKLHAMLLSRS